MEWFMYPNDVYYAQKEVEMWKEISEDNKETIEISFEFYKGTTGKKGNNPARLQIIMDGEVEGDVIKCRKCDLSGTLISGNDLDTPCCPDCGNTSK